jgi:uncharacterized membrane protein HdeD (DUF308 family)
MALKNADVAALQKLSGWFTALGVLLILFGFIMIIFPVAGTFTLEILFGILLLIAGLAHVVMSFMAKKWSGFFITLFAGILYVIIGLLLLTYPLKGIITITLLLGIFLLIAGVLKIALSSKIGAHNEWLVFDGVITILLGLLILIAWPSDSLWVVGLLFGIDMLFAGISFLLLSSAANKLK